MTRNRSTSSLVAGLTVLAALAPQAALAHHPLGGQAPASFLEGLMSGFGHPVIGLDHLAFVLAIGLLASLVRSRGALVPPAFVVATVAGTAVHLGAVDLPLVEVAIALSVVGAGAMLLRSVEADLRWALPAAAVAGLFHGYAYGESIVGAETTPLLAYLVGFAAIQLMLSLGALGAGRWLAARGDAVPRRAVALRVSGGVAGLVGAYFLVGALGA